MPEEKNDISVFDEVIALNERGGMSVEDYAIQQKVDAALDTAVKENGYEEIATWTAARLALDLVEHNVDFEAFSPARLRPFVDSWQCRNGGDLVQVKWNTGPHSTEAHYVPRVALELAETNLITQLITHGNSENKRANANAMETIRLGRQLSITRKALHALTDVVEVCAKLRRFDKNETDNPIAAAAPGWLCLQDGKELDGVLAKAREALKQLAKEYPND